MTLLAGIDFSTRQLDAALIPLDDTARDMSPPVFRTAELEQGADRIRSVHTAIRELLQPVYAGRGRSRGVPVWSGIAAWEVTTVWVEEPYGRYRTADRALLPLYGAILASIPTEVAAAGIPTQEWRRTLGLSPRLSKADAIRHAQNCLPGGESHPLYDYFTEHLAEAYLIALAGRTLTWRHAA